MSKFATLVALTLASPTAGLSRRPPDVSSLSATKLATRSALLAYNPWPMKNGNVQRSGQGYQRAAGARNLSEVSWVFEPEDPVETFYSSPVIDHNRNTLITASAHGIGKVYSVNSAGQVNWVARLLQTDPANPGQMPTPVLYGEQVFVVDGQGSLYSLSMASGQILWRQKYAYASGSDSWSLGIHLDSGTLFTIAYPSAADALRCQFGGTAFYAHSWEDGHVRWRYNLRTCTCNVMPAIQGSTVYISDVEGGLYGLDIASGREVGFKAAPPLSHGSFTTAATVVAENGMAFAPSNLASKNGVLRAFDLATGREHWSHIFDREATAGAAVYRDLQGRLLVALGISNNPGLPPPFPALNGLSVFPGSVFAYDALTGEQAWEFRTPVWRQQAVAGSSLTHLCLPDAFTNPAVDAAGLLYIGWGGGVVFAINSTTGAEVSRFDVASGMQGEPGIAQGLLVATSCRRMVGFLET